MLVILETRFTGLQALIFWKAREKGI